MDCEACFEKQCMPMLPVGRIVRLVLPYTSWSSFCVNWTSFSDVANVVICWLTFRSSFCDNHVFNYVQVDWDSCNAVFTHAWCIYQIMLSFLCLNFASAAVCEHIQRLPLTQGCWIILQKQISLSQKLNRIKAGQCPLLALSVHGPQMRMCVWVDGMNLKYALCWHICISVHSVPCQCYTQKEKYIHILKPFEDSKLMGLKVDIAKSWTICKMLLRLTEKSRILPNDILHDKSEGLRM